MHNKDFQVGEVVYLKCQILGLDQWNGRDCVHVAIGEDEHGDFGAYSGTVSIYTTDLIKEQNANK